jgi:electron transfer flavoprotein alpha subunit
MKRCMILAEHRKGALREVSLEAIGAASSLSPDAAAVVLIGNGTADQAAGLARYAPRVIHLEHESHAHYEPALWTAALRGLVEKEGFDAIVLPHSYHGMDLAGRLAATLDWPLVTDVTGIELEPERVVATRMVYGGRVASRVAVPGAGPLVISVRPTAFAAAEPLAEPGTIEQLAPGDAEVATGVEFVEYVEEAAEGEDITQAEVVVSVGRGVGEEENVELVGELARALGGVLACSRPIVDRGWLPRSRQVGTSGRTIRPKVYLAVGISGAFQHVAGMKGASRVIAINRDPHAPIFKAADYGVVADLFEIVPALTAAARERD